MRCGFRTKFRLPATVLIALPLAIVWLAAAAEPGFAGQAVSANQTNAATSLQAALSGMDQAALDFTSVAADLEYTKATIIVNDYSTESGKIYFQKSGNKLRVMLAFTQPVEKYVLLENGKVSIYQPNIAEVDEYSLANNQGLMEQFLLLGFGTSGSELKMAYQIRWQGEEMLDGQRAVHLVLTPKSAQVAARLASVELWLSPQTWQPLQQKFIEPSKDYLTARYRNVQENAKIPPKRFELPIHGKVRTVRPQAP